MNTTQIRYFLTAARVMNFTEAAKELHISQPALSKQIVAIENELNIMLFIRDKKKLRLTPAGLVLYNELPKVEEVYDEVVRKAKVANEGNAGEIVIGLLEGQRVGEKFTDAFGAFSTRYPNISIRLLRDSFSGLRRQLAEGSIDIALTLDFDIFNMPDIVYHEIETCPAFAAVAKSHPLAKLQPKTWSELKGQIFIAVDKRDCYISAAMIEEDCFKAGFRPTIKYAPSLETAMLWIEAGVGIGFINSMNNLVMNPAVVALDQLPGRNSHTVMAMMKNNQNPTTLLFINFVIERYALNI